MKRILKWFGIGVLSIVILSGRCFCHRSFISVEEKVRVDWQRSHYHYRTSTRDSGLLASCGSHICNTATQSVLSRKTLGWSA